MYPLTSLRDRDPSDRAHDLDFLDRVVGDWLTRNPLGSLPLFAPLARAGGFLEISRRELLYRTALMRLDARLRLLRVSQVDRIQAFVSSTDVETHEAFLLYLILSEWFHRLDVNTDAWFDGIEV